MSQAHRKLRALAGLALGASLLIAGCGDAGDGLDPFDGTVDAMTSEALGDERIGAAAVDAAPAGSVVGIVEKPASRQPPSR